MACNRNCLISTWQPPAPFRCIWSAWRAKSARNEANGFHQPKKPKKIRLTALFRLFSFQHQRHRFHLFFGICQQPTHASPCSKLQNDRLDSVIILVPYYGGQCVSWARYFLGPCTQLSTPDHHFTSTPLLTKPLAPTSHRLIGNVAASPTPLPTQVKQWSNEAMKPFLFAFLFAFLSHFSSAMPSFGWQCKWTLEVIQGLSARSAKSSPNLELG